MAAEKLTQLAEVARHGRAVGDDRLDGPHDRAGRRGVSEVLEQHAGPVITEDDVIGFGRRGEMVFHYVYSTAYFCGLSWNAAPVHLEDLDYP